MVFSAKSKTFLVGEYSVLFGGGAILLLTKPEFVLSTKSEATSIDGVHPNSPAYAFYLAHRNTFKDMSIKFVDPHGGLGGFGASSAQYALLYKLFLFLSDTNFEISQFLDEYRKLARDENSNSKPSGADCLAQYYDNHIFFDAKTSRVEHLEWLFPDIAFVIFKTKFKLATHSHLQELGRIKIDKLLPFVLNVKQSILTADRHLLRENIRGFFCTLHDMGFVDAAVFRAVNEILKIDGVVAAKGCGAKCVDTIVVIFEKSKPQCLPQVRREMIRMGVE
jgi:mevalonate kinase